MRVNESGRSMIEMLGVLAIIGVLSVGGIAGYSKAMNKFKTNKVSDNVSMLVANIKTLYAQQNTYHGLDNKTAVEMGVIPDELGKAGASATATVLKNPYNGLVFIKAAGSTTSTDEKAFVINYNGLSREACITLATNDWGSGFSSGLIAISAKGTSVAANATAAATDLDAVVIGNAGTAATAATGNTDGGSAIATPGGTGLAVPMSVSSAATACGCTHGNNCSVTWKYY